MVAIINLNISIDKTYYIPDFKKGEIFRKNPDICVAGGKGVNVARVLKTLGINSTIFGFCMGEMGRYIIKKLNEEKFLYKIIHQKEGQSRTCITVADKNGTTTDINEEGSYITEISYQKFLNLIRKQLPKYKYLCISGRTVKGADDNLYRELIKNAKKSGIKTYIDITGKFLEISIKEGVETVKINSKEFFELSRKKNTIRNIKTVFEKYKKYGLKRLIVTDGSKKTIAINEKSIFIIKGVYIKDFVSSVGAGDSFMAGLIYCDIKKMNFIDTLKFATACAISDCRTLGAGIITKKDTSSLISHIKISQIG
jgi:tagatose 6-phosphate kinase